MDPKEIDDDYAVVRALNGRSGLIDVLFDPADLYTRPVSIPAKARGDAIAILSLDLARSAPFDVEAVFWSVSPWRRAGSELHAEQYVAKRARLAELAAALERAGAELRTAGPLPEGSSDPFWDRRGETDRVVRGWGWATAGAALATCCLLTFAGLKEWRSLGEDLALLEAEAAALRDHAVSLRELQQTLGDDAGNAREILAALNADRGRALLLAQLTETLPNSVWISELHVSGTEVRLSGMSQEPAATLIRLIEMTPWAAETTLSHPGGAARFDLKFQLNEADG